MNSKKQILTRFLLVVFAFSATAHGQQLGDQTLEQLQESPAGSTIVAFVEHINEQDESNGQDVEALFAEALIKKLGKERLVGLFEDVRSSDGQLEIWETNRAGRFKYVLKAKGTKHKEWLDIVITLEESDPYKINAIEGIDIVKEGPKAKTPMIVPGKLRKITRPEPTVSTETIDKLDSWIREQTEANTFSGVVLVAKDFEPVFHKAYGLASKRYNVPVKLDTKFRLASMNKIFTATAILQLCERGQLGLDDKLTKYLDGFSDPRVADVTIQHLLSHSSGWGAYWEHPEYLKNQFRLRSLSDYMPFIKQTELDFAPGTKMQYSNSGYNLLGAVIEKVTGKTYYEFVRENIYKPLEMNSTDSYQIDHIVENLATGYTNYSFVDKQKATDFPYENIFVSSPMGTPAGGGCSTATDLLKFAKAVANNKLINESSEEFLRRDIGVRAAPTDFIFHNGGGPGQSTWMQVDVGVGYSIIVLCNLDSPSGERVVKKIGELFSLRIWP